MRVAILAGALVVMRVAAFGQQAVGPFTAVQAAQGHKEYSASCAACHRANLSGGGEAPSLAGGTFLKGWGSRSTRELFDYIQSAMPLGKGGSLSDTSYAAVVAFLLQANGATPGGQSFTSTTEVRIGDVANGEMPPGLAQAGEAVP